MKKIILAIGLIFLLGVVSASWIIPKSTTCSMMNVTGNACDQLWCNIIECSYNSSIEACVCINEVNQFNESTYLNKSETEKMIQTEVDNRLEAYNESIFNKTISIELNSSATNSSVSEDKLLQLRTDLMGEINDLKDEGTSKNSNPLGSLNITWLLIGGLALMGLWGWNNNKKKNKENDSQSNQGNAPSVQRKIQSTKEMNKEEQIDKLLNELKEQRKTKKKVKKKPVEDEEEFEDEDDEE